MYLHKVQGVVPPEAGSPRHRPPKSDLIRTQEDFLLNKGLLDKIRHKNESQIPNLFRWRIEVGFNWRY